MAELCLCMLKTSYMKNTIALFFLLSMFSVANAQTDCLEKLDPKIQFNPDSLRLRYYNHGFSVTILCDTQTIYQTTHYKANA